VTVTNLNKEMKSDTFPVIERRDKAPSYPEEDDASAEESKNIQDAIAKKV